MAKFCRASTDGAGKAFEDMFLAKSDFSSSGSFPKGVSVPILLLKAQGRVKQTCPRWDLFTGEDLQHQTPWSQLSFLFMLLQEKSPAFLW